MFVFDVETLGVESTAVVLSAAIVHFDPQKKPTYQEMLDNSCLVKFNVLQQFSLGRSSSKSTMEWWKNQHDYVRKVSFDPSKADLTPVDGLRVLHDYLDRYDKNREQTMWARGSLDQMVIDSLAVRVDVPEITGYNMWRDVRTAVDIMYGTTNGYVEVEHEGFERYEVIKHHPVHDCALDAMQLMYGKPIA
jgi:hypothetical protein